MTVETGIASYVIFSYQSVATQIDGLSNMFRGVVFV